MSKVMGLVFTLTMLGGASVMAQPVLADQIQGPQPATVLPYSDVVSSQSLAWALQTPQQPAATAPQVTQQPKKLPLADFGQWDEAASEN